MIAPPHRHQPRSNIRTTHTTPTTPAQPRFGLSYCTAHQAARCHGQLAQQHSTTAATFLSPPGWALHSLAQHHQVG